MKKYLLWLCIFFCCANAIAHPMPSSVVSLSVLENTIQGEAKIPLLELGNAVGDEHLNNLNSPFFKLYFTDHIQAVSDGKIWATQIENISVISGTDEFVGVYKEAVIQFTLTPTDSRYLHTFTFNYDAVIHQVVTHSALVYISQDWSNGIQNENEGQQVGIIQTDIPTGKIFPLQVNLQTGSWWKGFSSMLGLGMQHIKEGTDHLLFLIVLLLPAMLLTNGKKWGRFGGIKYSTTHLLKIVTAFTFGHSITLLAGALGWLYLPGRPVEILIAVSILVSAVHALRPIFPGKEMFVAAGFGLIHGLAFAAVLSNLHLGAGRLAVSILGFNLGIEIMQLFVILLIVPWLMLLSKTVAYKWLRTGGAILAGIAAIAWMIERTTGSANRITNFITEATQYSIWAIAGLAIVSLIMYGLTLFNYRKTHLVS